MPTIAEIMCGERGIEGVQQLLTADSVRDVVQSMLQPTAVLQACHLRRAKFKPGRKLTAYYDAEMSSAVQTNGPIGLTSVRPLAVTWTPPGTPHKLAITEGALGIEIQQRGLAAPFARLICDRPDANMHVQMAPFDPIYPHLARLMDPDYAREMLGAYIDYNSHWNVTPIRYRPRQRHVLRYDAQTAPPSTAAAPQALFAKVYADADHQPFYVRNQRIADWLAASSSTVTVLRPLAYLPADFTILYAQVNGEPLSDHLAQDDQQRNHATLHNLTQSGAALRTLHQAPADITQGLPTIRMEAELKAIRRTCEHIAALLPETWRRVESALRRAADMYGALPQEAPTFVHGDFKADHVLTAGNQLTLIDFDSCALADPAYDIGKFLADLVWWSGDAYSVAGAQMSNAFLAGYGLAENDARLQRARIWQTLIGIKMAAHRVRIFDAQWGARTDAAIQNCVAGLYEMSA